MPVSFITDHVNQLASLTLRRWRLRLLQFLQRGMHSPLQIFGVPCNQVGARLKLGLLQEPLDEILLHAEIPTSSLPEAK